MSPAGRPPLPNARSLKVYCRVSKSERHFIEAAAAEVGTTVGAFARDAIMRRARAILKRTHKEK